ncbi:acyloxyacyl hydrolase [Fibrobacterota bacterium]
MATTPLSVYSGGLGGGAIFALSERLSDESEQYLKLSFVNSLYLRENLNLFVDIDWFAPGGNYGADLGFDFMFSRSDLRPFMGAGLGAHLFDKKGRNFGENLGASATVHMGFLLDLTDRLQIRVRIPYHIVFNADKDQGIGVDLGFLFSDKFRRVKKLNY